MSYDLDSAIRASHQILATADAMRGLDHWRVLTDESEPRPCLVYGGDTPQRRSDCDILPWNML